MDVWQALVDPTRRAIVSRLANGGAARVTEIAAPFAISLNSVSKHIRALEAAGLVSRRVEGRDHVIALTPAPMAQAAQWLEDQAQLWRWRLGELEKVLDDG